MAETTEDIAQRVLVLAPIGRDAQAAAQQLAAAGLSCVVCSELKELCKELDHGAGAALVAEEAFADSDEVARAFRDDVARCSDMMSPGVRCLAG